VLWIQGLSIVLLVQGRGEMEVILKLLQFCYITVLWIQRLTSVLLVQDRREMAGLPAHNTVLLHHNSMDKGIDCSVVSTG